MSIYNTLRSLPSHVADMLMKRGFVKDLTPADRDRLDACVEAMAEEWFGASSTVVATMKEEKPKKEKKTKAATAVTPAIIAPIEDGFREDIYILNIIFHPIIILNLSKKQIQGSLSYSPNHAISLETRNECGTEK